MHWEKILGQFDKDVLRKQLEEATTEDILVRFMRIRRKADVKSNRDQIEKFRLIGEVKESTKTAT